MKIFNFLNSEMRDVIQCFRQHHIIVYEDRSNIESCTFVKLSNFQERDNLSMTVTVSYNSRNSLRGENCGKSYRNFKMRRRCLRTKFAGNTEPFLSFCCLRNLNTCIATCPRLQFRALFSRSCNIVRLFR